MASAVIKPKPSKGLETTNMAALAINSYTSVRSPKKDIFCCILLSSTILKHSATYLFCLLNEPAMISLY